jgi:hypothetical protein
MIRSHMQVLVLLSSTLMQAASAQHDLKKKLTTCNFVTNMWGLLGEGCIVNLGIQVPKW